MKKIPRILLAAVSSNSGKTAAACGMMSAYVQQGLNIRSCKCGPDYIDPMFHREVLGVDSEKSGSVLFRCRRTDKEFYPAYGGSRPCDSGRRYGIL